MNMKYLEKFIRSSILLLYKLKYKDFTDFKVMIKLVYDLIFSDQSSFSIDENIKNYIVKEKLKNDPIKKYHFRDIKKIEDYMDHYIYIVP